MLKFKRKAREAGTPRKGRRVLIASALTVLVGVGMIVGGIATAGPAQANPFGICDPNETFNAPAATGGTTNGVTYTRTVLTPGATGSADYAIVIPTTEQNTPTEQYGGAGLHWNTFGLTCADVIPATWSTISNLVYELVALWPMRVLGALMAFAFSTAISDWVLSAATPLVTALSANVFLAWAPLIAMVVLLGIIWKVARGKAQQGWGQLIWMTVVVVAVTGAMTGPGLGWMRTLNDYARDITACITFSTTGAGCATNSTSGMAGYANGMVESLAQGTWAIGALGDIANDTPTSWDLQLTERESDPAIATTSTVHIPTTAIPAMVAGSPTYAEVFRWTQTYTAAETAAMKADPGLVCSKNVSQSPKTSDLTDLAGGHPDSYSGAQLCSYKWLVRAALASQFAQTDPQEYLQFRGITPETFTASLGAIGLAPLSLGIGAMGFQVLLLQLEMIALFIAGPVVALFALVSPKGARKWTEYIAATLVRRLATGLALGLILWIAGKINTTFINVVSGPYDIPIFPPQAIPMATSLLTIGVMVAGFRGLTKLQSMMMTGLEVPTHSAGLAAQGSAAVKQTGKKVLQVGVAAAAGALSAGTGFAAAGALRGVTRSGAIGGTLGRAARAGDRAGNGARRHGEAEARAKERGDDATTTVPAGTAAERGVTDAWRDLLNDPKIKEANEKQLQTAEELQKIAEQQLESARGALASHEAMARIQERAAAEGYEHAGMAPADAQARARSESATARQPFADAVVSGELRVVQATEAVEQAASGAVSPLAVELAQAISRGESADRVAGRIGADDGLLEKLRAYEDAVNAQRRVMYSQE